jgi:hypothetical protein
MIVLAEASPSGRHCRVSDRSRVISAESPTPGAGSRKSSRSSSFEKIMHHVWTRVALVIAKRHKRSRGYGWSVLAYQSPVHLGLISLTGTVVAPRPFKDWRDKPNAGGERRR